MRQSILLVVTGTALGMAASFALTRLLSSLLFGVGATDLPTFMAVPLVLIAVSLAATFIPARRATRVDRWLRYVGNSSILIVLIVSKPNSPDRI